MLSRGFALKVVSSIGFLLTAVPAVANEICRIIIEDLSIHAVKPAGTLASGEEKLAVYLVLKQLGERFPSLPTPTKLKVCTGGEPCSVPGGIVIPPAKDGEIRNVVAVHEIGHQIMVHFFQREAYRLTGSIFAEAEFQEHAVSFQDYFYHETVVRNSPERLKEHDELLKELGRRPIAALRELRERDPRHRTVFTELLSLGGTKRAYEELFSDLLAATYAGDWDAVAVEVKGSPHLRGFPKYRKSRTDRGPENLFGPAAHHLFPEARHAIRVRVGEHLRDEAYMDKFLPYLAESFARDFAWMVKEEEDDYIYMWVDETLLKTMEDRIIQSVMSFEP